MKKIFGYVLLGAAIAAGIDYAAGVYHRAKENLVTLNVRKMPLAEVLKKVERQTWETALAPKWATGTVTLNVRNAPLNEVMNMIAAQTGMRSTVFYPLYSSRKSLAALEGILQGNDPAELGWTNLATTGGGPRGFGPRSSWGAEESLNLRIVARDLQFTTMVLERLAQVRIVPEDGTEGIITLTLNDDSAEEAVEAIARKTDRKWTQLYALRPRLGMRPVNAPLTEEQLDERRAEREVLREQILATLSPEDRAEYAARKRF